MTLTKFLFPPLPFRYDVQGLVGQLEHVMPQRFQMMSNSFPNAMNGSGEVGRSACWEAGRGGGVHHPLLCCSHSIHLCNSRDHIILGGWRWWREAGKGWCGRRRRGRAGRDRLVGKEPKSAPTRSRAPRAGASTANTGHACAGAGAAAAGARTTGDLNSNSVHACTASKGPASCVLPSYPIIPFLASAN